MYKDTYKDIYKDYKWGHYNIDFEEAVIEMISNDPDGYVPWNPNYETTSN